MHFCPVSLPPSLYPEVGIFSKFVGEKLCQASIAWMWYYYTGESGTQHTPGSFLNTRCYTLIVDHIHANIIMQSVQANKNMPTNTFLYCSL
jgi:hypothetical protein